VVDTPPFTDAHDGFARPGNVPETIGAKFRNGSLHLQLDAGHQAVRGLESLKNGMERASHGFEELTHPSELEEEIDG